MSLAQIKSEVTFWTELNTTFFNFGQSNNNLSNYIASLLIISSKLQHDSKEFK